jgi:quercetin dioxygenase-like cupin family protein
VGEGKVALMSDRVPPEIAVVSVDEGRVVARVSLKNGPVGSLATSPDGQRFYYAAGGFIWSIASSGGPETRITAGDSVAADPNGRDLVVALSTQDSNRLVRVPASGGPPQSIDLRGDLRLAVPNLKSGAIGPNGRIAVTTASNSRWLFSTGLVDPRGALSAIPLTFDGETQQPLWTHDGRIIAVGVDYNFTLWRFRPIAH